MGFFAKLFGVKVKDAREALEEAVVSLDPEAAGEAEIEEWKEELNKISTFVVKAQQEYDRELKETDSWKKRLDESMEALEILESEYNSAEGTEKAELEVALNELMNEIDEANSEYERELVEDTEAKEYLDELLQREKEIADTLRKAEKTLKDVQRSVETQKMRTDRAKEKAEALRSGGKKLGTASRILQKQLEELKTEEAVAKRATTFMSDSSVTQTNDRVKSALAKARGEGSASSVSDRLASFKNRHKK